MKRTSDPQFSGILSKITVGICDKEVMDVLQSRLQPRDRAALDLDTTVVICSTVAECSEINAQCLERLHGNAVSYDARDTDHNGHDLRKADHDRIQLCRDRLPDTLVLKIGARVVLRRNLDIDSGWVNGTLAVDTALTDNCVIVRKLTNTSHRYPIPRFRQKIDIHGASYSIMRQQYPLQLAYGVAVHRVQGCTVQNAVVCLNNKFLESGQAYVALSRVRKLAHLTLWDFCPSAIGLLSFYKKLLAWCDSVDCICPTPSTEVVDYHERCDDSSNAPLHTVKQFLSERGVPSRSVRENPQKCAGVTLHLPEPKKVCLAPSTYGKPVVSTPTCDTSSMCLETLNVLQTVPLLLGGNAAHVLTTLETLTYDQLCEYFTRHTWSFDRLVYAVNEIHTPYAALHPELHRDSSACGQCHPLLLNVLKPVATTGNGNCAFNALSLTISGTEELSVVLRLLCVYGLIKYRDTMIRAITRAWGSSQASSMHTRDVRVALTDHAWGTDNHLFILSLILNRPIFLFNSFYFIDSETNQVTLSLPDLRDVSQLVQSFSLHQVGTRTHVLYCNNLQADLLQCSNLSSLPNLPLMLSNIRNYHWVAMLLQDASVLPLLPIPYTRVLQE